jgi:hypothetical protein
VKFFMSPLFRNVPTAAVFPPAVAVPLLPLLTTGELHCTQPQAASVRQRRLRRQLKAALAQLGPPAQLGARSHPAAMHPGPQLQAAAVHASPRPQDFQRSTTAPVRWRSRRSAPRCGDGAAEVAVELGDLPFVAAPADFYHGVSPNEI